MSTFHHNIRSFYDENSSQTLRSVYWQGKVERIDDDPLKIGRVRVRIYGYHTENVMMLPSNKLPFASVPVGLSLDVGDTVNGYFMDDFGEQPVIVSRYVEVKVEEDYDPRPQSVIDQAPFPVNAVQKAIESSSTITNGNIGPVTPESPVAGNQFVGEPNIPRTARGVVEGTVISLANLNRIHVCDIREDMLRVAALARVKFGAAMKAFREAVKKLIQALGLTPSGSASQLVETAKYYLRKLKELNEYLSEIKDWANVLVEFAKKIRAVIDWILSLPSKLLELLRGCLSSLLAALKAGFSELFITSSSTGTGDYQELINTTNDIINEAKTAVGNVTEIAATPARIAEALTTPASAADLAGVESSISSFLVQVESSNDNANTTSTISSSTNLAIF